MNAGRKLLELKKLGSLRRSSAVPPGCYSIGDFFDGRYECEFVSPWSLSAHNPDARLMLALQDWCGANYLSRAYRPHLAQLGHDPNLPTNRNLKKLVAELDLRLDQTFGTNAFPYVKDGAMSAGLERNALRTAVEQFLLPQIRIVSPAVAVVFGKTVYDAVCDAIGERRSYSLAEAIDRPLRLDDVLVVASAHPGRWLDRHRGWEQTLRDWQLIKEMLHPVS